MLEQITYYQILGKPLIMYGGIITLLTMLFAASIPFLQKRGVKGMTYQLHVRVAITAVILALIHGTLGILHYF